MKEAPKPHDEALRLATLESLQIMDTEAEQGFDDITELASIICDAPISLVSLVDESRQWFKSKQGLGACETERKFAFCAHAILQDDIFIVEDATKDERFHDNPLVTGPPNVIFYAGVPLKTKCGYNLGSLCVIDNKPRKLNSSQINSLKKLAGQVLSQMELRLQARLFANFSKTLEGVLSLNKERYGSIKEVGQAYLNYGLDALEMDCALVGELIED
ncbi:MAG: GAF domain-containing protein, partial [Bacteriovoracaceae bacterium]|nr:GAF domain-containing protein [Bacteriovoracaceae bacterium]